MECFKMNLRKIAGKIRKIAKKDLELKDVFDKAIDELLEKFDDLTFDERDKYPEIEGILEEHLGRKLTSKERNDYEFKRVKKYNDIAIDEADNYATQKRRGDRLSIARAKHDFEKALSKI